MALHCFYGGTFDPVHLGHLAIARAARDQLQATIRLMPASDPPHRPAPGATAEQRLQMLALAVQGEPGLVVDRRELDRSGPSYSVETLRELRQTLGPLQPLALLVGADSFVGLPTWHQWTQLFDLAHFVVAERPGVSLDQRLPVELQQVMTGRWAAVSSQLHGQPAGLVLRLQHPLQPQSASKVRALVASGGQWKPLVPAPVADFIEAHALYTALG